MKIVIIGGSGLIGKKLVKNRRQQGHEVVAASPSSGVNSITGEGLAAALVGAKVVVDVANAPSWEDKAVLEFFETSVRNLLAAEAAAGGGHHVALSVVGTDRLLASGYFRAKMAQENLIKASPVLYTIVRATQFFEFVGSIAQSATDGQTVRLPPALMQRIVADDVAAVMAEVAVNEPLKASKQERCPSQSHFHSAPKANGLHLPRINNTGFHTFIIRIRHGFHAPALTAGRLRHRSLPDYKNFGTPNLIPNRYGAEAARRHPDRASHPRL
jgi:hypothetical protein